MNLDINKKPIVRRKTPLYLEEEEEDSDSDDLYDEIQGKNKKEAIKQFSNWVLKKVVQEQGSRIDQKILDILYNSNISVENRYTIKLLKHLINTTEKIPYDELQKIFNEYIKNT